MMLKYNTYHLIISGPLGVHTLKLLHFVGRKVSCHYFWECFCLNGVLSSHSSADSLQETNENGLSYYWKKKFLRQDSIWIYEQIKKITYACINTEIPWHNRQ